MVEMPLYQYLMANQAISKWYVSTFHFCCLKLFEKARKKFKFFQICSCDNYKLLNEFIFTLKSTNYYRFIFAQTSYLETTVKE